ncbi:unnamed protein product, partial [marine sediment metagenome]
VIASRDGAMPEVVRDGEVGFVCDNIDEMIAAVKKTKDIKPINCNRLVKNRFTRKVMAENYLKLYAEISEGKEW